MTETDNQLKRIADLLLLNASFTENPGLMNGKMGIAIFFYHYYRYTGNNIYNEFAGELIDQIYEDINISTPVNFEDGLAGIGWGIEYLVKNRFVDADTDEALAEIDSTLYRRRLNSAILIDDASSMFGYGLYYLSRLTGHTIDDNDLNTLIKKYHLIFLIDECERILVQKSYLNFKISSLGIDSLNSFLAFLITTHRLKIFPYKTDLVIKTISGLINDIIARSDDSAGVMLTKELGQLAYVPETSRPDECSPIGENVLPQNSEISESSGPDKMIDNMIKRAWQNLIYCSVFPGELFLNKDPEPVYNLEGSEDEWKAWLSRLNKNNPGLSGLAGLGLLLAQGGEPGYVASFVPKLSEQ